MRISDWSSDVCSSDLPRRRNFPRELRRDDLTPVGPAVQNGLHLGCVPGHDDVGQQTQGVSHRLHFLGPLGLSRAHSAGINRTLQGIDRLTPGEYPTQLLPEGCYYNLGEASVRERKYPVGELPVV